MKFYIQLTDQCNAAKLYIHTEIDSGGMSAWLTKNKEQADNWSDKEGAESFIKRLAEPASKFHNDKFEVVT